MNTKNKLFLITQFIDFANEIAKSKEGIYKVYRKYKGCLTLIYKQGEQDLEGNLELIKQLTADLTTALNTKFDNETDFTNWVDSLTHYPEKTENGISDTLRKKLTEA